jgi:hypothetical protein
MTILIAAVPSGAFEPITPGSTKAVASTVTHGGICRVVRHQLSSG